VSAAPATAVESKIPVDFRTLSCIRPLAGAYAFDFPSIAARYAGDPGSPQAWRDAIARAQQYPRRPGEIARIIAAQQQRRGAHAAAIDAARLLAGDQAVAVVTGQQAGAFGGPLYTLLKAITTIQLARRVAADHGVPVAPVFWVEAEDHDWAEVRSTTVLDADLQPQSVALPDPEGAGVRPVAALKLDERVAGSLSSLGAALQPTDFSEWVGAMLRDCYRLGEGIAAAFATLLDRLLGSHGLVVFDASDPAAKPLVADLFARELQFGRTAALAAEAGEALRAAGHEPQVVPAAGSVALFRIDGARRALKRDGGEFVAGEERFEAAALVAEAVDHPERFGPNVLLRPIVQDTLLPTVCYVAGPSELAYLGQLRGVYEHFGVPMPLVHQRASATLVDAAGARFLARYGLHLEELRPQDDATLNRLLQAQLPAHVEQAIADAQADVQRVMARVIEVMPAVDPTLAGAAKTTLGRMEHDLRTLHGKVIQAAKKRDETLRRQFTRARAQAFPLGEPQERVLGLPFFLNRYGPALVDRLFEELPLEMGHHWVLTL